MRENKHQAPETVERSLESTLESVDSAEELAVGVAQRAGFDDDDLMRIGMAVRESTSPLFVKACDEFIYLRTAGGRQRREPTKEKERAKDKVVPDVAKEAVQAILARSTSPVNPSAIKAAVVRKEPDFDERDHGFSSFTRMLEQMEKEGLLKLEQGAKGQWYVLPP